MNSRNDLNFKDFEEILLTEKKRKEKNAVILKAELDVFATEDEINDTVDMAELHIENMLDKTLLHKIEADIIEIDAALGRIKAGTYGICEKTAQAIPIERLITNPWARAITREEMF